MLMLPCWVCCAAINPPAAAMGHAIVASPAANLKFGVVNPAASVLHPIDPRLSQTVTKLYWVDITRALPLFLCSCIRRDYCISSELLVGSTFLNRNGIVTSILYIYQYVILSLSYKLYHSYFILDVYCLFFFFFPEILFYIVLRHFLHLLK